MKRLLVHVCCGPCATHSINDLRQEAFNITIFFSNSNIHPKEEYVNRLNSLKNYAEKVMTPLIIDEYNPGEWLELVKGYEESPEGGERCQLCIGFRLKKTALYAKAHGFESFTTTLSISPHKNAKRINELGAQIARECNIPFLPKNFKKRNGFKKSIAISKEHDLYRQNYCGCVFSKRK